MNEHDGQKSTARWNLEVKHGKNVVLDDCYIEVAYPEHNEDALRLVLHPKRSILLRWLNVTNPSLMWELVNDLRFDTDYTIRLLLKTLGVPTEQWELGYTRVVQRHAVGQPDGLFTITVEMAYNEITRRVG